MTNSEYKKIMCPFCKHRTENRCNIVTRIDGTINCTEYELDHDKRKEETQKNLNNLIRKNK